MGSQTNSSLETVHSQEEFYSSKLVVPLFTDAQQKISESHKDECDSGQSCNGHSEGGPQKSPSASLQDPVPSVNINYFCLFV